jgi:bifunctional DNA-binding transcriptional regulator/antitoxin component of YhaV-PrlF toxin-antitoxin module
VKLPKAIVERIQKTDFFDIDVRDGEIVLRPLETVSRAVTCLRQKMKRLEITEQDIDAGIRWARQR